MFDLFSWSHILILLTVALVVVGPKDLPKLMHMAGKWAGSNYQRAKRRRQGGANYRLVRYADDFLILVSGDRESEVRYLAEQAGITEVHAEQTPEQKLAIVDAALREAPTLFVGDGINDAPALTAATVGVAFGPGSDIAAEAADAVILDPSLLRVDQLLHIGRRMRTIALQSAGFGMAASVIGMAAAAVGWLPPLAGAIAQEGVDLFAVLNAVRAAMPGRSLADF